MGDTAPTTEPQAGAVTPPQTPPAAATPPATEPPASTEPETFDREYVTKLRGEAAATRSKLREAEAQLTAIADKDKTEQQKLAERVEAAEKRASSAEGKLLRGEAAQEAGLPAKLAARLQGSTKEELLADAKALAAELGGTTPQTPRVPGGPQGAPSAPAGGMDGLIRGAARG